MRILITGSRDWNDADTIKNALRDAVWDEKEMSDVLVVHGGARGADMLAGRVAEQHGMMTEAHPANWDSCGPDCNRSHYRYRDGKPYCPRSGYVRNAEMVALGADICLAFIKNHSKGAEMCVKLADAAGIPVRRYIYND
jgi:hypothetical protein